MKLQDGAKDLFAAQRRRRRRGGEEEEGAILLTHTEPKLSVLLATADGGRNERQMEKSLPTCLSSSSVSEGGRFPQG